MQAPVGVLIAAMFCAAIAAPAPCAEIPLAECQLESATRGGSIAARCGEYRVRENRDDARSRQLALHVAVVPALRLKPLPDPLVILSGGPGQAAGDFYALIAPALERVHRDRDIVLLDQRGTGRSNRLECPLPDDSEALEADPARLNALVRGCLAALPGDPRFYTTSIAVRDLDEVRAALGYETVNLYGVSYGTRVAQHYMRRYPARVRTAILDGVVPPDLALGPDTALEAQRVLDAAFARCAAEARCAASFPALERQFQALQARLRAEPATLSVPDPVTAQPQPTTLDLAALRAAIRMLSYTDETLSLVPLLIHEAQTLGQPQALAAQHLMVKRELEAQIAAGMHFAVLCSEDAPRWGAPAADEHRLAPTYLGTSFMQSVRAICAEWPRGPVDADFGAPLASAVPALLLSGENDPITPARYAAQVLRGLTHARHLVLAGQGHGQLASGCVPRLVAQFIASGTTAALDDGCSRSIRPAPFMLSRSASAP